MFCLAASDFFLDDWMGELEGIRMVIIEVGECIAMFIMLVKCWEVGL